MVVLVRDPLGQWRDEALVATDPTASAAFVIPGYCRRWSVELAFFDSKQFLGLHDPRVRSERSVERAHPMAWFVGSLTILWYCVEGHRGSHVETRPPVVRARRSRRRSRTCWVRYGCRCGSTRFMESPVRNRPRRNASEGCSTRCRLWLEVRKSSPTVSAPAESVPDAIGPITLDAKRAGKPGAGEPHAGFDVAGAGDVTMGAGLRPIAKAMEEPPDPTVRRASPRPYRRAGSGNGASATAPLLDSTC